VLSSEDSAAPGRWSTDSRPYQREIMDVACDQVTEQVTVKGASQWGKTQVLNNILGFYIHLDPGPIMVVQPTIAMSEKWSKTRFTPMVRDSAVLSALVSDQRSRDSSNTILEKRFIGGILVVVGANAPTGLASQPIRVLLMDETDRFKDSAGTEGDPEKLAEARTADFRGRKKIYRCSTPTLVGDSNIEESWQKSDQRQWWMECPHCGHLQTLSFWQVAWSDRNWDDATYACKGGGCEIKEPELRRAVRGGRWIASRPDVRGHAGFDVPGVMVKPMAELAQGFTESRESGPRELQVFYNTQLGELWNPRMGEDEKAEGLLARARQEAYSSGQVPDGVGLLQASVDVQTENPQRLELLVRGFGAGQEAWTIQHVVIPGNLALSGPWDELEAWLLTDWPRVSGGTMRIRAAAVDTGGHFSKQVHAFRRRKRMKPFVYPVKGASRPQASHVHRANTKGLLYLVDTVGCKDEIYAGLKITNPGYGYQHFPNDLDAGYFQQLMAERPCRKSGRRAYERSPKDAPNEILDLHVYCLAALAIFRPRDLADMVRKAAEPQPIHQSQEDKPMAPEDLEITPQPESETEEAEAQPPPPPPAIRVIRPKGRPAVPASSTLATGIRLDVLRGSGSGSGGSGAW
jgi:phage terminase large subunit GpA-like protein